MALACSLKTHTKAHPPINRVDFGFKALPDSGGAFLFGSGFSSAHWLPILSCERISLAQPLTP
jgi:hypothetical protein